MSWLLQIGNNAPQLFTELQCVNLKRELRSQAAGTFTFRLNLQAMETDPVASVDDLAAVLWNSTPFFSGRVTKVPLAGSAAEEEQTYEISDGWSDFERITYQQQWNRIVSVDEEGYPTAAAQYSACCLLGVDLNGNAQSSGEVITDAVNWAIARGANCQLGAILVDSEGASTASPVPIDEVTDLPVAEVIKRMLRYTPDAAAWFDYSATPCPKFNVTRQAQCGAVTVPFPDAGEEVKITPRNDLVRPQVLIRYEQANVSDGETFTSVIVDAAPDGADGLAFGALVSTVRLAGSNATFQKQPIQTTPIPQNSSASNAVAWLQQNNAWLRSFSSDRLHVNSLSVAVNSPQYDVNGNAVDYNAADYPNQLVSGTIAKWMQNAYPSLKAANVTVTASVSYNYPEDADAESLEAYLIFGPDDGSLDNWDNDKKVTVGVVGTNAVNQTYAMLSDYTEPESPPVGMAAALYAALGRLQYEGEYSIVSSEAAPATALGVALNLTGGRAEWETMNALVQEISDDLDNGTTTYKFGPPAHLIEDLMEQLRATRQRVISGRIKERQTGQPSAPTTEGPGLAPNNGGGDPPAPTHYPWEDFIEEQEPSGLPDDLPATWDVLLGYGQSSFAGGDAIDHSEPIENFELSVGNDGSGWDGIDHAAADLDNGLSIQSGNQDAAVDVIYIATTNGSVKISPDAAAIYIANGFNPDDSADKYINIDRNNLNIQIGDTAGATAQLTVQDVPLSYLYNPNTGNECTLGEDSLIMIEGDEGFNATPGSNANIYPSYASFIDGESSNIVYLNAPDGEVSTSGPADYGPVTLSGILGIGTLTLNGGGDAGRGGSFGGIVTIDPVNQGYNQSLFLQLMPDWGDPSLSRVVLCSNAFSP